MKNWWDLLGCWVKWENQPQKGRFILGFATCFFCKRNDPMGKSFYCRLIFTSFWRFEPQEPQIKICPSTTYSMRTSTIYVPLDEIHIITHTGIYVYIHLTYQSNSFMTLVLSNLKKKKNTSFLKPRSRSPAGSLPCPLIPVTVWGSGWFGPGLRDVTKSLIGDIIDRYWRY